ncbi:MAG: FkbM family methyltransferase [Deltaproteobacteria bacterium]|nr:FkbM family methyltransferase [Deltaproteobacteria bacterium]
MGQLTQAAYRMATPLAVMMHRLLQRAGQLDHARALVRRDAELDAMPTADPWNWRSKVAKLIDPPRTHSIAEARFAGRSVWVDPSEVVGRAVLYGLPFEAAELRLFDSLIRPGDIVFDVGANFGLYSALALRRLGDGGKLFAFEPNPRMHRLLERNATSRVTGQVERLELGLSNQEGEAQFVVAEDSAYSSLADTGRLGVSETIRVSITTLDAFVRARAIPRVNVMKIDVEGFEYEVLSGGRQLLERDDAPVLMIEIADVNLAQRGRSRADVLGLLGSLGFEVHAIRVDGALTAARPDYAGAEVDFLAFKNWATDRVKPS